MGIGENNKRENGDSNRKKEINRAIDYLYRILSKKDYTEKELIMKLKRKNFSSAVIAEIVKFAKEEGYIDDMNYAERFIKDTINLKKKGPAWIRFHLYRKGIKSETIDSLLEKYKENIKKTLKELYPYAIKRYSNFSQNERKRKIWNYLTSRGFYSEDIKEVLSVESQRD